MMLRKIKPTDLPTLYIIENLTQKSPWSLDIFEQCLKAYPGWVIEVNSEIVGFALMAVQAEEVHLLNIAIHPDFQHQGLGQRLLSHLLVEARETGASMIYLEVRRSNLHAIKFYDQMGFSQLGVRKNYYSDKKSPEDALVFAMELV